MAVDAPAREPMLPVLDRRPVSKPHLVRSSGSGCSSGSGGSFGGSMSALSVRTAGPVLMGRLGSGDNVGGDTPLRCPK
eukprot:CAMPEP_0198523940 /NCGR_PEP_ID=MMETSP1462-20131121/22452_1 /TAXON_ID=1333877 /ORGANISM="Brandtodinium nutriculum, Strain RCC3387" /LENGTH=77 /DNA_ID=CAMNT_0044253649 /DNA_START=88 /DNA_END=318 /DNA_ORIENTATION=+